MAMKSWERTEPCNYTPGVAPDIPRGILRTAGTHMPPPKKQIYLAGSLRNPGIVAIAEMLQARTGISVFADWFAAGEHADDAWRDYCKTRGLTYRQALNEPAAKNVFEFDKKHILASDIMVVAMPAGKSAFLELGWFIGQGKPGYILLDDQVDRWDVMFQFATGVFETLDELSAHIKENH